MPELDEREWLEADGLGGCASATMGAGIGHISELVDGGDPHVPGGCPFHAPSLAEVVRVDRQVLSERRARRVEP